MSHRPATPPPSSASEALRTLADDFWDAFLEHNPVFATELGDRRFDDRVGDISPAALAAEVGWLEGVAAAAEAIDPGALTPAQRISRRRLIDETTSQAAWISTGLMDWTVDPLGGPQTRFLDLADFQPVSSVEEGRAMVARWQAIGPLIDQHIDGLRRGIAEGRVAVRNPVERVIDELRAMDDTPPEGWRLAGPAAESHDDWPAQDLTSFRDGVVAAVRDVVAPAFRRYREVLEHEVLPIARPPERPGLAAVPGGDAAYRALILAHTTLPLDPATVHRTGLEEIARIDAEFVALGRRLLGTTDLASTLLALRSDPALHFATAEEVHETARRSLARAEAAVPAWFGRLPRAACEVVPIPAESAPHQTIAYYAGPALDGSRPGRYYINLHDPTGRPRYEAECLAFHEAVPGHHLQIAIGQELEGLPAFQRTLGATAFFEGWGLYIERLADEMGLYSGDLDRFGVLSFDAWRAGRLVVDTGIHALGWTRDEAIAFLREHTALDDFNIANEIDRYIVMPAQALAYKVGQLEFLRLRADARERLGDRFDIRGFHDAVLGAGAVSMASLGEMVEAWVAEVAAG